MKPIIFVLQTPPPYHGSTVVGKQIKDILLKEKKYQSYFINTNLSKNISDIGKNNYKKYVKYLISLFFLFFYILKFKPKLIYIAITVNGIGFLKDFVYIMISKLFFIDIVYHFHNKGISNNTSIFYNTLYRIAFKNESAIILSEKLKFDIKSFFNPNKIFICPNAIPNISNIERDNNYNDCIKILFISNLLFTKGILDLIETCIILRKQNINYKCTIIGAEKDLNQKDLNLLIEKNNLTDYINYIGPKYDKEKYFYLNTSNILIYPSYSDCLPLVLIEALQFSLPIIATNEGAISDIVISNYNGFIVNKNSPFEIFQKIKLLTENHEMFQNMKKNSRLLYETKYSMNHFKANISNILYNLNNE